MSNIYVRSTDGSDADNGSTWALAKATINGAAGIDAAGDNIYVSQAHAESTAGAVSWSWAGTQANPTHLVCVNDGAAPPTAVATTATVTTTGNNTITFLNTGAALYVYGITFVAGSGGTTASHIRVANKGSGSRSICESCSFQLASTSASSVVSLAGQGAGGRTDLLNCTYKFNGSSPTAGIALGGGLIRIVGGSFVSGTTSPTALFALSDANFGAFVNVVTIEGLDLTNLNAAINIFSGNNSGVCMLRNCKLPASWSGSIYSGAIGTPGCRLSMYNCDAGATNYKIWVKDEFGEITQETTLVRSGGATDGTTALSWKMVTNADPEFSGQLYFVSDEIVRWNESVGSSKTVTIELLHDSATNLKNDEVWMEVQYMGSSATPVSSTATNRKADVLATAADQTTSSATWTTTGMTNPNKQKLSVTFTPQMKGFFIAKVFVTKASYTLYVDPKLTVS